MAENTRGFLAIRGRKQVAENKSHVRGRERAGRATRYMKGANGVG